MNKFWASSSLRVWLAIMGVATLVLGASYAMVQQSTRLSADDLPRTTGQMAKQELESGSQAKDVVPTLKTDLKTDTSVFTIVTDNSEHVLASSAVLDGQTPLPPAGVFSFTNQHASDHFTWQPESGVRMATEVIKYGKSPNDGFIITGQSLKPYEDRIKTYTYLAGAGWLAVLAWSYLVLLLPRARSTQI
ncbi:MAG TPA: hypothetical protein VHD84_00720 [Candidatus Saccharimonadales bacterium]|nr:hypothetical protein [Candidatus Saccharimonadales bacterium]